MRDDAAVSDDRPPQQMTMSADMPGGAGAHCFSAAIAAHAAHAR